MNELEKGLELSLLGSPRVMLNGTRLRGFITSKAEALLYYLALTERIHARTALAALFWPDVPDSVALKNLRDIIFNLRKLLGDYLLITRQTMGFNYDAPHQIDVVYLRSLLQAPLEEQSVPALQEAIDRYRGELMEGFYLRDAEGFEEWFRAEREQLRTALSHAIHRLVAYYLDERAWREGLQLTQRLLAMESWDEAAHRQQMRLLVGSGQRAAAMAQYERCRQILADEFGIEPAHETRALYQTIQSGEASIEPPRDHFTHQNRHPSHPSAQPAQDLQALQSDLSAIPQLASFVGREQALQQLEQMVLWERKRLVTVFGLGGQGKTTLVANFATLLCNRVLHSDGGREASPSQKPFQRVLWYACHNAPSLVDILCYWLQQLSIQIPAGDANRPAQLFVLLFNYLQRESVLLILDNFESFLRAEVNAGAYQREHLEIEHLLERFTSSSHRGTLVLTSREQPLSLVRLANNPMVAMIELKGMVTEDATMLLHHCQLSGEAAEFKTLTTRYSGNPLALKIVAETIRELFAGDLSAFLAEETLIVDDIRHLLDQQFARLSDLEVEIMLWLAIERGAVTPQQIWDNLVQPPPRNLFYEALRSLQRRFLIETEEYPKRFTKQLAVHLTLQAMVMEYATEFLINAIAKELEEDQIALFQRYLLVKAQAEDHIRQTQRRLLLQPLLQRLTMEWGAPWVEQRLRHLLDLLHERFGRTPGYAATNLLHLMVALGLDLRGKDFSNLSIWQADLRHIHLPAVNFANADLQNSVFAESLGAVTALAFSPDNRLLATATTDGDIYLWRTDDGNLAGVCRGNGRWIWSLAFSPDSRTLASGCADQLIRLWDLADLHRAETAFSPAARLSRTLVGHTNAIFAVAFSPDGALLASGSADATIAVWQVADGTLLKTLLGHTATISSLLFIPPMQEEDALEEGALRLASAGRDGSIRLWDLCTATIIQRLEGHTNGVTSIVLHPSRSTLISGSDDHTVRLWDLATGETHRLLDNAHGAIHAVVCAENIVAAAGDDQTIYVWNIQTGKLLLTLSGHTEAIIALALAGDGYTLASGSFDQSIRLWDLHKGQTFRTYSGYRNPIKALALHPDEHWLVSANVDRSLSIWPLVPQGVAHAASTPSSIEPLTIFNSHLGAVHALAFHPDGGCLASVGQDEMIRLWRVGEESAIPEELDCQIGPLFAVAFSPDGLWLAVGGADAKIGIWHLPSRRYTHQLIGHTKAVTTLAFTADATQLLSGDEQGDLLVWSPNQSVLHPHNRTEITQPLHRLQTATKGILALAVSPDGQQLAVGGEDPGVELWELATYERLQAYATITSTFALAFHPDGQQLAIGGGAQSITLLALDGAEEVQTLAEHQGVVRQLIFTQDGHSLYSAGDDERICLWQTAADGQWRYINSFHPPGLYRGLNIYGVTGIDSKKRAVLRSLGAIEEDLNPAIERLVHNIPTALDTLYGRTADVALLTDKLLDVDTRLVTLWGEGGIGKTAVALDVARTLAGLTPSPPVQEPQKIFADGIWLIPLTTLPVDQGATELLITTIAGLLDLPLDQQAPLQAQLFEHLRDRQLLLILDNFEQVGPESDFLLALLQAAPRLKVLVVSRYRLDLLVQVTHRLPGLALPTDEEARTLTDAELLRYSAIQLFVEQAKRLTGAFPLTPSNRAAILWLCRYLNGLPLGLKLAAAQLVDFSLDEIVAAVQTDLSVLATKAADLPKDQQSLYAILLHAWVDLPKALSAPLTACAVFVESFDADAAREVAQVTTATLQELVNRSFLQRREDQRYVMHEFVRTFIYTDPDGTALIEQAAARHAAYFAALLAAKGRRKDNRAENFQRLARELANLRAAWQWALQHAHFEHLQQCKEGLCYTYEHLGQLREALDCLANAIETLQPYVTDALPESIRTDRPFTTGTWAHNRPHAHPPLHPEIADTQRVHAKELLADLYLCEAMLHELRGDLAATERAATLATTMGQALAVPRIEAHGYYLLALQAQQRGQLTEATNWIERTASLTAADDALIELQIAALNLQGILSDMQGDHVEASRRYKQALPLAVASEDRFQERLLVNNLGIVALAAGDWGAADSYLQRNLLLSAAWGNSTKHAYALMNYALLLDATGLYEEARQNLLEGLHIARAAHHHLAEVYTLQLLALNGFHSGHSRIAIKYAKDALALIDEHQFFTLRAAALATLAHNLLALGELQRAFDTYAQSIELWRANDNQLEIGTVLAGCGYAALRLGRHGEALTYVEEILPMLDHILAENATEAMWVVVSCYFILLEAGDERLHAILNKGYQALMQQAETIRDPEMRKAFLKNSYPHRTIVRAIQLYQSTGVSNDFSYTTT